MREAKQTRTIPLQFYVSPEEKTLIEKKMSSFGIINMSGYLRKMAIDGYMLKLQTPELKEIIHLLRSVSNNVNQIAKRANVGEAVDAREIGRVREVLEQLWQMMNALLKKVCRIDELTE